MVIIKVIVYLHSPRYDDSGATRECPAYILHDGARRGCNFTRSQLPVFSLVSICVNSSSPSRGSTPAYLYLKIQNHGKFAILPIPVVPASDQTSI